MFSHLSFGSSHRAKDFAVHAQKCSELLAHYTAQWRDREVYWAARDRSALHGDLLTVIVDSFDRSKLYLPRFPFNRTPKRPVYQTCQRSLLWPKDRNTSCELISTFSFSIFFCVVQPAQGVSLTLTAVLCHGHGCWMFLSGAEGIGCGSSWNWECVPRRDLRFQFLCAQQNVLLRIGRSFSFPKIRLCMSIISQCVLQVMRALEKVWVRTRSKNAPFPSEFLGA